MAWFFGFSRPLLERAAKQKMYKSAKNSENKR